MLHLAIVLGVPSYGLTVVAVVFCSTMGRPKGQGDTKKRTRRQKTDAEKDKTKKDKAASENRRLQQPQLPFCMPFWP